MVYILVYIYYGKTKKLINYAHLNDRHGDLSLCWFVEYSFRLPGDDTFYRRRLYDGLGAGTDEHRRAVAEQMIATINEYLKSGEYLKHDADYSPVFEGDGFREEQQRYAVFQDRLRISSIVTEFLQFKKASLRPKSIQDYTCKLDEYVDYMKKNGDPLVPSVTQPMICDFLLHLSTERGLCRRTIEKYEQLIRMVFDYAETNNMIPLHSNPVYKIPKFGKVIDCSPSPYSTDDRKRLKDAIEKKEPYLWLACEMMYYCAIRPGTELRLLQIKHIHRESKSITIPAELAKNKRTESIVVPDTLLEQMTKLGVFLYEENFYLFGRNGVPGTEPMGKNTMRNRFNDYRELLGISKDKKFYSWKHTGALSALEHGVNTVDLRDHLRHKSIETTEQYIRKYRPKNDTSEKYIEKI